MEDKNQSIDIKENTLLKIDSNLLGILLKDMTTGKNIIWATDNYKKHGSGYSFHNEITVRSVTGRNGQIIKPRTEKSKAEQQSRIRDKAEVFTPSWICNCQNNLVDCAWFTMEQSPFNTENEKEKTWTTNPEKIIFSTAKGKTWQDYVKLNRLEITCGEAPYLVSRYDTVTGEYISVNDRIGLLDRKLRVVSENTETKEDWIHWATRAAQSTYGYEWQGDNVLIARENVLYDIAEHFEDKFDEPLATDKRIKFAKIIAWNIWQMDGLKMVIPESCNKNNEKKIGLFETFTVSTECEGCKKKNYFTHNGMYCKIKDWKGKKMLRFVDMLENDKK